MSGHALDPSKRITQYQHRSWRLEDGTLPGIPIYVAQTNDGYLMVGTRSAGIFRFDGVRFVPWLSPSGPSNNIHYLLSAKAGGLWVGNTQGVARIEGTHVLSDFDLNGPVYWSMVEDADGSLWAARPLYQDSGKALCHITDHAAHCFGEEDGVHFKRASSIALDGKGGLWIGNDTDLVHWNSTHSKTYEVPALKSATGNTNIASVIPNNDGSVLVGINRPGAGLGLERFFDGRFSPLKAGRFDGSKITVNYMFLDSDQNLWVATERDGLYRIHGANIDHFGSTDGLSNDNVNQIYEDREGIVWVVTDGGLDSFADQPVTTISRSEGLPAGSTVSVIASRDGTIWVANFGSLDSVRNGVVSLIDRRDGLPGMQVTSLLEDHAGQLWVGVDDGLFLYKNHHFRRLPEANHRPLGMVVGITEDSDGNIWAECASNPRKLVRIRNFRVQEEYSNLQVPPGHALAPDPKSGIWVSTVAGDLARIWNGAIKIFPLKIKGETPREVEAEADGSILVAAPNEGLIVLHNGNVQRLTRANSLPCDGVFAFIHDNQKSWWLEAPCGYISIGDSEMQRWFAHPDAKVHYRILDRFDGAQPNLTDFNLAAKSPDGRLWFVQGSLQNVDPRHLRFNTLPPPVHIEQIVADRKTYEVDSDTNRVALPPRVRDLQIDYTALSLVAPAKVRFRYRLEGRDAAWQEPGTRRQAFYSDLWPGNYHFRVIACNNDGVWNETGALLNLTIAPAWYQTSWFFALCAIALLLLLWTLHQQRLRQVKHQFSRTLEARVDERTRIARDLHDTLLQSFQGLTLHFQRARNLLPERTPEAIQTLDGALDGAEQAIIEGRDAIYDLRSPASAAKVLAEKITAFGEELVAKDITEKDPVRFQTVVEGSAYALRPNAYIDIFRIAREALRNAFIHSEGHLIETELAYTETLFRLRIRDDGKGIDPNERLRAERSGHWGLKGMRERAERLGGQLEVWSEPGAGTEIELRVPASIAYEAVLSPNSSWRWWRKKRNP